LDVANSRVVVVGGVRRLGRTIALDLASRGAAVCVTTHRPGAETDAQVEALRLAGAPKATAVAGDVRTATGAAELVDAGADELGGLDVLVFAASGPFVPTPPQAVSEQSWDASFDTIAKGFFFSAGAARRRMQAGAAGEQHQDTGVIVAITDLLGVQPWPAFSAHGAAKAALIHLVRELAAAWAGDGIRVCGIAPGPVDLEDDEHRAATLRAARGEAERLVGPDDIAAAVRFCLSTAGVTGVNIPVDNGSLLGV